MAGRVCVRDRLQGAAYASAHGKVSSLRNPKESTGWSCASYRIKFEVDSQVGVYSLAVNVATYLYRTRRGEEGENSKESGEPTDHLRSWFL